MMLGAAGVNAAFHMKPAVGLGAILSAAAIPWVDVILVVEAKHLPADLGLDPDEWDVIHDVKNGAGKAGVAAAVRKSTSRIDGVEWRLGLKANRWTLDRWILTIRVRHRRPNGKWAKRTRRYRVTHMVPKPGWVHWGAQAARTVAGRWSVIYADWNKLARAVRPVVESRRKKPSRIVMRHIVGMVFAPNVARKVGRVRHWRTPGVDHDIVAVRFGRGKRPNSKIRRP